MLKNRFLSVFTLAFAAGIAVCLLAGTGSETVSFSVCAGLAVTVCVCCALLYRKRKDLRQRMIYPLLIVIGLCMGSGWLLVRSSVYDRANAFVGRQDLVYGVVTESGSSADSSYFDLRVERSKAALPSGTHVRVYPSAKRFLQIGEQTEVALTYRDTADNRERGYGLKLIAEGTVRSVQPGKGVVYSVRRAVLNACADLYGPYGVEGLAQALTVRERSLLSKSVAGAYQNAGLSHVLAISGLHLTILTLSLGRLLAKCRVRKQVRDGISIAFLLFYCFLTGFSPSVTRAFVMLTFVLLGGMTLHRVDSLTTLFFALLLLLLADPYALLSVGLQLSFLSCLGILLLQPEFGMLRVRIVGGLHAKHRALRSFLYERLSGLSVSCCAILFTFPVTVFSFGTVSWIAPLCNLLLLPLFSPLLCLLFLSVLLYLIFPPLAHAVACIPGYAFRLLHSALMFLEQRGIGSVQAPLSAMWVPLLCALGVIVCSLLFKKNRFRLILSFFAAFAGSLTVSILLL